MMQKRSIVGAIALLVCTLLAATAGLQSKGPPPSNWPVNMSLNTTGDGVLSDPQSHWCTVAVGQYCNGQQNVRAEMLANTQGNFVFDTNDRARTDDGRRLVLNFGAVLSPPNPPVPNELTVFTVDAFIGTIGVNGTNVDGNLRTMLVSDPPLSRKTRITWVEGNFQFSLRWDGLDGHSYVDFTCIADDGQGGCMQWTASPPGTATAGLYSVPTKGSTTETYYDTYSMPFTMTLVRQ